MMSSPMCHVLFTVTSTGPPCSPGGGPAASSELPAAGGLPLTWGPDSRPRVSRKRLPGGVSLPGAASPWGLAGRWKGVIFSGDLGCAACPFEATVPEEGPPGLLARAGGSPAPRGSIASSAAPGSLNKLDRPLKQSPDARRAGRKPRGALCGGQQRAPSASV